MLLYNRQRRTILLIRQFRFPAYVNGHPEPLTCPEDRTRKSIALYYYTRDRPEDEATPEHNTLFQARPGEELPVAPPAAAKPAVLERVKHVARQLTPPIVAEAVRRRRARG